MIKKISLFIFIFLLIIVSLNTIIIKAYRINVFDVDYIENKIIFVDDDNIDGPWDGSISFPFKFIRDGINNSSNGSTIYVLNGCYFENIIIDKSIFLIGENKNLTIVDGNYNDFIINIVEDNLIIKNFTIRNSGGDINNAAIMINSNNNYIYNCIIYRTKTGIYLNRSSDNIIKNCIFHNNGEGIFLNSSYNNNISECFFSHNSLGLNIGNSENIILEKTYANTNGVGFFINYSRNIIINKCALYNNNDNQGGIFLNDCLDITINNSIIQHNGFGVNIEDCNSINIIQTNLNLNTHTAVYVEKDSRNILIYKSNIFNNFRFGLYIDDSYCNLIENNLFNSLVGAYIENSICDLSKNWWGSAIGPAFFEKYYNDRLVYKNSKVKILPWLIEKVENSGPDWSINFQLYNYEFNNSKFDFIELFGIDSDNDSLPDWWEEKWGYNSNVWNDHSHMDPDGDGLNNIQECYTDEWGSNPFYKDIFLEYDWIKSNKSNQSNKLSEKFISEIIKVFYEHNITIHIDDGVLGGGEEIPQIVNFSFSDLRDLYWNYFLHKNLNNPRKNIFHYCLVCDYGPSPGFAFFGWDNLDSFLISAQFLQDSYSKFYSRDRLIAGGAIHELGHTLGLFVDDHGGNDNRIATWILTYQWWKYLSYKSCMNYWYTYKIINFSEGSNDKNDFNDWENMDLYFFKNSNFDWPKT